ncbi:MAG: hypothetical protein ACJ74Q_15165 [Pyrinomonadaceae bacterium]
MTTGRNDGVRTIDVTPNYGAMFTGFLHDARVQAEAAARKTDDRIRLEDLQAVLSRLNVAAAAMASAEDVEQFRAELNEITSLVSAEAARRGDEGGDEDDDAGPSVGEPVHGSGGRYRFVPDGEQEMRPAALDTGLFEHVETVGDEGGDAGYSILRRRDDEKLFALANWTEAETAYEIVAAEAPAE